MHEFTFMKAIRLRIEYAKFLMLEHEKRDSAEKMHKTECLQCGFCCITKTCTPRPKELHPIAEYFHISVEELVDKYMVGDRHEGFYYLRWALKEQSDVVGAFLDWERTYDKGHCVFLKDNKCLIHEVKPSSASKHKCWAEEDGLYDSINSWKNVNIKRIAPKMIFKDDC